MIDNILLIIASMIGGILLITALILYLNEKFRQVEILGKPLVDNYACPWVTPNHLTFSEEECIVGPNGRYRVTLQPKDYDINKKNIKIRKYVMVVGRDRRKEVGNTCFGVERNRYIYEPRSILDLPNNFRNSFLGKVISKDLADKEILDVVLDTHKQMKAANSQLIISLPSNISDTTLKIQKNFTDLIKGLTVKKDEKKDTAGSQRQYY